MRIDEAETSVLYSWYIIATHTILGLTQSLYQVLS